MDRPRYSRSSVWCCILIIIFCCFISFSLSAKAQEIAITDQEATQQYTVAATHYSRGNWDLAAAEFDSYLTRFADRCDCVDCRFFLGESLLQAGRLEEAAEQFLICLYDETNAKQARIARFRLGHIYFSQGQFDQAKSILKSIIDDPNFAADAGYLCGIIQDRSQPSETSLKYWAAWLRKHPDHRQADSVRHRAACFALEVGKFAQASQWFSKLSRLENEDLRQKGLSGLAWAQLESGKLERSAETFIQYLKTYPEPAAAARATITRAKIFERLGRPDDALAVYELAINRWRETDQFSDALWAAARLTDQLEQPNRSLRFYERLLDECPDLKNRDRAVYETVWIHDQLGQTGRAFESCRAIYEQYPKSEFRAEAGYRLALDAFENGRLDEARRIADAILKNTDPPCDSKEIFNLRLEIAAADRDWSAAFRVAGQYSSMLSRTDPEKTDIKSKRLAIFWKAESLFYLDKYTEAQAEFCQLEQMDGCAEADLLTIVELRQAQILVHQGRWTQAHEKGRAFLKSHPDFAQSYEVDYLLGRCLAVKADFEAARKAYRHVLKNPKAHESETAAMAAWMIGESYFHQKDYSRAIAEYLRVEILYPYPRWQACSLFQAGKCYQKLDQHDRAAGCYRRLMKQYPESSFAKTAESQLRQIKRQSVAETNPKRTIK
jgi:TolA-binding protein